MIIEAIINGENRYKLAEWEQNVFDSNYTLSLQTDDLQTVKADFSKIESVEILKSNNVVAVYSVFDTFSDIVYAGQVYVPHENIFCDVLHVTLKKSDIIAQVQRLDAQLNPVVRVDEMDMYEYRKFLLKNISDACQDDIHAGDYVEISSGNKKFTFGFDDQCNFASMLPSLTVAMADPESMLYFHASGDSCELMSVADILKVYVTLQSRLVTKTTYCNMLNSYIRTLSTKEELESCFYGMELPEEYKVRMNEIVSVNLNALLKTFTVEKSMEEQ